MPVAMYAIVIVKLCKQITLQFATIQSITSYINSLSVNAITDNVHA